MVVAKELQTKEINNAGEARKRKPYPLVESILAGVFVVSTIGAVYTAKLSSGYDLRYEYSLDALYSPKKRMIQNITNEIKSIINSGTATGGLGGLAIGAGIALMLKNKEDSLE